MATQGTDAAPMSAADKMMAAALNRSLNKKKMACASYMDNPNTKTEANLSNASGELVDNLKAAGHEEQAGQMSKAGQDFRSATPAKKQRIAETLAQSLLRVNAASIAKWTIVGAVATGGLAYALYEINSDGRVEDASDVNMEGELDVERTAVDEDTELTLVGQDEPLIGGDTSGAEPPVDGGTWEEEIPTNDDTSGLVDDDEGGGIFGWVGDIVAGVFGAGGE